MMRSTLVRASQLLLAFAALGCSDSKAPPATAGSLQAMPGTNGQTATVGSAVANAPAVRLLSTTGEPMAGVTVTFAVTAGGGSLAVESTVTNAEGVATSQSWTLGTTAGVNAVVANAAERTVQFSATGAASAPVAMVVEGDGQEALVGDPLPEPITVTIRDVYDNPVAGAQIAVAVKVGAGSVGAPTFMTNAAGTAQIVWTLGHVDTLQELEVSATGTNLESTVTATPIVPMLEAVEVSAGALGACVRRQDGRIACWGDNSSGQVGDGTNEFRPLPVPPNAPPLSFSTISFGQAHVCALTFSGAAYCWGAAPPGDGSSGWRARPTLVTGGHAFASIATGSGRSCGLDATGSAWCWGDPPEIGAFADLTPRQVPGSLQFTAIAVGHRHHCAVASEQTVYCWGTNAHDALGTGGTTAAAPTPVLGDVRLESITLGINHSCGLDSAGRAYCWGSNANGELGYSASPSSATPQPAAGDLRFVQLTAGFGFTCGVEASGEAHCWGRNSGGRFGNGISSSQPSTVPHKVLAPDGVFFRNLSAGAHSGVCATAIDDQVYCWGVRLIDGEFSQTFDLVPRPVPGR